MTERLVYTPNSLSNNRTNQVTWKFGRLSLNQLDCNGVKNMKIALKSKCSRALDAKQTEEDAFFAFIKIKTNNQNRTIKINQVALQRIYKHGTHM